MKRRLYKPSLSEKSTRGLLTTETDYISVSSASSSSGRRVSVSPGQPEGIPNPPGNSYQFMNIDAGSEGTITSENADNILVRFKVSRQWIGENNIDVSTIRMTRFHDGQWSNLPTYQEREEEDYIYFYAETPGFSIFSVVGDEVKLVSQDVQPVSQDVADENLKIL